MPARILVYIGRFQPFHQGHLATLRQALTEAERVVVLLGSARASRTQRNPWTWQERAAMLTAAVAPEDAARIHCAPLRDYPYDDAAWVRATAATVRGVLGAAADPDAGAEIGLIGHGKDQTSYYLKLFPHWGLVAVPNHEGLSATAIRDSFFGAAPGADLAPAVTTAVPPGVAAALRAFAATPAYGALQREQAALRADREAWAASPYPPLFVTVDALVRHGEDILMVERGRCPGKGLLALPGGFVDQYEPLVQAMLRELAEETRIALPAAALRAAIRRHEVFDDPYRSSRGRVITHAFLVDLPAGQPPPAVVAADDAAAVAWRPIAGLEPEGVFEDHPHLIERLLDVTLF